MSNKGVKILILVIVLMAAVSAVLAFYPTIVQPPVKVEYENLHKERLSGNIRKFSQNRRAFSNDTLFDSILDKIKLYEKEDFLTDDEVDFIKKELVENFVPVFVEQCNRSFRSSVWHESEHRIMLAKIRQLRNLTLKNRKTKVVSEIHARELNRIERVIDNYNQAKKLAAECEFYSVDDLAKKVENAEMYMNMSPLSHCSQLVSALSQVKLNIANSHFNQVSVLVEKLSGYYKMSNEEFQTMVSYVLDMIKEYDTCRSVYYGDSAKKTELLKAKASKYYEAAQKDYGVKHVIVKLNNQWRKSDMHTEGYDIYESFSNYHIGSSDSMMMIEIRGLDSFEFRYTSNGEEKFDYVMIGLDRIPQLYVNDYNSKGFSASGKLKYNYAPVKFDNLDGKHHIIYIAYHKDLAHDVGEDRGYVMIPANYN